MISDIIKRLRVMSTVPPREGGLYDAWLEQADARAFLSENLSDNDFVVFAALPHTFIHAVLVPAGSVSPPSSTTSCPGARTRPIRGV
jgi:hypothetical protein